MQDPVPLWRSAHGEDDLTAGQQDSIQRLSTLKSSFVIDPNIRNHLNISIASVAARGRLYLAFLILSWFSLFLCSS